MNVIMHFELFNLLKIGLFHLLIIYVRVQLQGVPSARAKARQLGKMVKYPNQTQPSPGARADVTPCTR